MFVFDKTPFEQRLAETIAWCALRVRADDPKHSLRDEGNRPSILERDRASAVQSVVGYRGNYAGELPIIRGSESLLGGRLLVYFPDASLNCGTAEFESRGFFDVHNVPPWDTWIALAAEKRRASDGSIDQYLISWVPAELVACVQAGIDVNPEQCIQWLDDTEVGARHELERLLAGKHR